MWEWAGIEAAGADNERDGVRATHGGGIRTRTRWRRENLSIYIESRRYCSTYLAEGEPKRSNLRYSPRQRTAIYTTVRMQNIGMQILPNPEVE